MDSPADTPNTPMVGLTPSETDPIEAPEGEPGEAYMTVPVHHWTEIRSLCSKLHPDMLGEGGVLKMTNTRLKGESPVGPDAVPSQLRLVRHDIDYCVYRLKTILNQFDESQVKAIFDRYLASKDQRGASKKQQGVPLKEVLGVEAQTVNPEGSSATAHRSMS